MRKQTESQSESEEATRKLSVCSLFAVCLMFLRCLLAVCLPFACCLSAVLLLFACRGADPYLTRAPLRKLCVCCLFALSLQFARCLFALCLPLVCCLLVVCLLFAYCLFVLGVLSVSCPFAVCLLFACSFTLSVVHKRSESRTEYKREQHKSKAKAM